MAGLEAHSRMEGSHVAALRITREWSQDWGHLEEDRATHGFFFREAEAAVQAWLLLGARHERKICSDFHFWKDGP